MKIYFLGLTFLLFVVFSSNGQNQYDKPVSSDYVSQYVPSNLNALREAAENLEERRSRNIKALNNMSFAIDKALSQVEEETFRGQLKKLDRKTDYIRANKNLVTIEEDLNEIFSSFKSYARDYQDRMEEVDKQESTQDLFDKAKQLHNNGNLTLALQKYTELIRENPQQEEFRFHKGQVLMELENYVDAAEEFSYLIKNSRSTKALRIAYAKRGWSHNYLEKYKSAIEDFSKVVRDEEFKVNSLLGLGYAYSGLEKFDLSNKKYKELLELDPSNSMVYNNLAWNAFKQENTKKALKLIDKSLENDVRNKTAWDSKCEILLTLNENKKAIAACNRAINLDKNLANSYLNRGKARLKEDIKEKACKDFSTAGEKGLFEGFQLHDENCIE